MKQKEIHFHRTTTLTAEQYLVGLTDFGSGRSKLFGNSADESRKVHHRGLSEADVTEGSGGIWERLHYDWSDPNRVVLATTDSNEESQGDSKYAVSALEQIETGTFAVPGWMTNNTASPGLKSNSPTHSEHRNLRGHRHL